LKFGDAIWVKLSIAIRLELGDSIGLKLSNATQQAIYLSIISHMEELGKEVPRFIAVVGNGSTFNPCN
jgi:hypothetical protein